MLEDRSAAIQRRHCYLLGHCVGAFVTLNSTVGPNGLVILNGKAGTDLLRDAVDVLAGSEARLEHARALVDLGAALRRKNRRTEARQRLREGVDLALRAGAFGLAARANEEIAATGARPRRVLQTGLDALTTASGAWDSWRPTG